MVLSDPYPADSEQFMLIEELYKQSDKLQERVDSMLHNEVNISALEKAVDKLQSDVEKLNQHSTQLKIMEKDLVENTEFRIKWPRGLLGSLPADSEQFMLIEELYKQTDKLQERVDSMLHNEVNISALTKAVEKLQTDVEKLKDKQREFGNGGNH